MTHFMGSKWLILGVINDFCQWCLIDIIFGWRISEDTNSHFKYIFQLFDLKNFPLSNLISIFFPFDPLISCFCLTISGEVVLADCLFCIQMIWFTDHGKRHPCATSSLLPYGHYFDDCFNTLLTLSHSFSFSLTLSLSHSFSFSLTLSLSLTLFPSLLLYLSLSLLFFPFL